MSDNKVVAIVMCAFLGFGALALSVKTITEGKTKQMEFQWKCDSINHVKNIK